MALLDIRKYPDEVLTRKAEPVDSVDDSLRRLAEDMLETMYAAPGLGLAAPQVGVSKRLIVADVGNKEGETTDPVVLFNPEIIEAEGTIEFEEGCLSLPEFTVLVTRAERVVVRGLDREGIEVEIEAEGIMAIVLQHEIDHLEGILLLDRASMLKRQFYKKRIKKQLAKAG
jgi:peptide deformylase